MRFLIQRGAQLNARNKEDNVINAISKNVPRAMEEFSKLLDKGITMEEEQATINLDFTKIFRRDKMDDDTVPTSLFLDLSLTSFTDLIEHPLCMTFLKNKFNKVIWSFVFFIMVPHFLFSLIYSFYSVFVFGHLCAMNDTDGRWYLNEDIPCGDINDTQVSLAGFLIILKRKHSIFQVIIASVGRIMLIFCLVIYLGKEIFTLKIYGSLQGYKEYWKRMETYRNIATIISIALVTYNLPRPEDHVDGERIFFKRWQYHVASFTCLLVWVETTAFFSKIPLFGKYCHMFK